MAPPQGELLMSTWRKCPDCLHHMGIKCPSVVGGVAPLPPTAPPPLNTHMGTDSVTVFRKKRPVLFQNPSELSDEELNDDLLQSDDEDVNMG